MLLALSSLLFLTWLLLSLIAFTTAEQDVYAMKSEEGKALLKTLRRAVSMPLEARNLKESTFSFFADSLTQVDGFSGLLLVGANGETIFSLADRIGTDIRLQETLRNGADSSVISPGRQEVLRYAALTFQGQTVGAVRLALNLSREHTRLAKSRRLFLAYFILDFLVLLVLGYILLKRIIILPIRRLINASERIASGDYSQMVNVPGSAEIAELADSFNAMLSALRNNRLEVERHVRSLEGANCQLQAAREEGLRSERLASVGLLAAGTAHEIGTPLAAIIGYAGILREELADDTDNSDYAHRIEQEAGRIDRIVRDLLDFARPSQGELELLQVGPIIEETLALLTGQGAFRMISAELFVEENLPELSLDRFQFQQVLINLLINARDATPQGGSIKVRAAPCELTDDMRAQDLPREVHGRRREDFGGAFLSSFSLAGESNRYIRIDIRDNGEGISPENLDRVFDPFFTTKEPGKGTGLGLSLAARSVDSFGGRITVSSDPGIGTCFSIWLPVKGA